MIVSENNEVVLVRKSETGIIMFLLARCFAERLSRAAAHGGFSRLMVPPKEYVHDS